ncbi:hypothetical protein IAG25_38775 [Caballeronia sp. EK]|uniref:hypothetical protein n=1 Tax=Caballeronia sp. EK TaxID=2767469 RepID=UPI001656465D|nr:hypothetical protein [Caballeronia sp. EK]MBC8642747.1 hypothetical protein [Caballeronia sp. EK]
MKKRDESEAEGTAHSIAAWNGNIETLNIRLLVTEASMARERVSLADIPTALYENRWLESPFKHPSIFVVSDYLERLTDRSGFAEY